MSEHGEAVLKEFSRNYGDWFKDEETLKQGRMSMDLYPYTSLFSPITINRLELKNRLVMAPMGNVNMADETGRPSEQMRAYFAERARGGVGLITSGLVPVSFGIDPSLVEKNELSYFPQILGSRTYFSGWRDIAASCHAYGSRFFIQLTAGLGRVGNPQCLSERYIFPRSASMNPNFYMPEIPCLRLSDRKLKGIVRNMGQAAADAKESLIDGVYLHGHEGYLLEQMTNRAYNRRKIGRYSDWQRFGLDVVEEIRKRCGPSYPIMYRIDLSLMLNETYGERMNTEKALKKFKKERSPEETLEYMKALVKAGVDLFDVDLGCYENWWLPHPPQSMPPAPFLGVAEYVKNHFAEAKVLSNQGIEVPIVAVGKLGCPDLAEEALRQGKADMIMLGRPLLADPDWPQKAYAGQVSRIRPCIGCQEACINEFVEGGHPACAVNPRTSFEYMMGKEINPAPRHKKIAVVGAGPAGVECALAALERGHEVWLFDRESEVGGVLRDASRLKIKYEIANYLQWLQSEVLRAKQNSRFHLHLSSIATSSMLEEKKFDAIVVAAGANPRSLSIEGGADAVFAGDVLKNPSLVEGKKNPVIIGGGPVGIELAYAFAYEHDLEPVIIEATPELMATSCTANRGHLLHYLEKAKAKVYNCSKALSYADGKLKIQVNTDPSVPNPWVTWQPILPKNVVNPLAKKIKTKYEEKEIDCDLLVLSVGYDPDRSLYNQLLEHYSAPEIHIIGDSDRAARVTEAVRSGYRLGRSL